MDALVAVAHPREADALGLSAEGALLAGLLDLKQLVHALPYRHKSGRLVDLLVLQDVDLRPLLYLNIHQHQRMQSSQPVLKDLAVKTIGLPLVSPQRDGHHLSEPVNLQSATPHCADDARIVDHLHLDA